MSLKIKLFLMFALFFGISMEAQKMAAIHYNDGKTEHAFIRRQILQEDEEIHISTTLKDRKRKIDLKEVKYIAAYPSGSDKDSTYVVPVEVYVNPKKSVKRWLTEYYRSPNISVFYGFYAKGLNRKDDSVYYYVGSGVYPMHYLYLKRANEKQATIWWSQDIDLDGNIDLKNKIKFMDRTNLYFSDAPKLQQMIKNGQLEPKDWKQIILEYELELKDKNKKTENFL